jgi:hypothetical protein
MAKQTHTKVRFMVSRTDPKSVKQHRRRREGWHLGGYVILSNEEVEV